MKIAVSSDEYYPFHEAFIEKLEQRGHEVVRFGSLVTKADTSWVEATQEAATAVTTSTCDEGIFLCWSGTGASIAANKVEGIRPALCWDAETARLARIWNHANALVLPNRIWKDLPLNDILEAWFEAYDRKIGQEEIKKLKLL